MRSTHSYTSISFGPFELFAAERTLLENGQRVHLRGRAFEVLAALVDRAGEVISKQELVELIWPGISVDDGALRVQVAAVRKALNDGSDGDQYITTLSGRGYSFTGPIIRSGSKDLTRRGSAQRSPNQLPARATQIVGRKVVLEQLAVRLKDQRFVTIVGPGGIGKTTVAVAIGHKLLQEFDDEVIYVSLAPVRDPGLLLDAIATVFGLVQADDALPGIMAHLRGRRGLLILDNCEHVIEPIAALAEKIFVEAPGTYILATSREAMRVKGEQIWHLKALECPPEELRLTSEQILQFPAAELFVERASAAGYSFGVTDEEARAVAKICQKLDGIALAIELAAGRATTFGLEEIAAVMSNKIELLRQTHRTAVPRHQTLHSTIDWSYQLLTEAEKVVFYRLSVFVGVFTLDAASAVASGNGADKVHIVGVLANLVEKSLITAEHTSEEAQFRLLDATRSYAFGKLHESQSSMEVSRRHANFYLSLLEQSLAGQPDVDGKRFSGYWPYIGSIRAALEWSFSDESDAEFAALLVAASCRLFLDLSLLTECRSWSERALSVLEDKLVGTRLEMHLQTALGFSSIFTKGNHESAGHALRRALELAKRLKDLSYESALLCRLFVYHERTGEFRVAFEYARRGEAAAREIGDPRGVSEALIMAGSSCVHAGYLSQAREKYESGLAYTTAVPANDFRFGALNFRLGARSSTSRVLWLQGFVDQAVASARATTLEASSFRHVLSDCIAVVWGIRTLLWSGNLDDAQVSIVGLIEHAEKNSLAPYHALGRGLEGEFLIRQGQIKAGLGQLQQTLDTLHGLRYGLLTSGFLTAIAEGMVLAGQIDRAADTTDRAIELVERNGDVFILPELLRMRAHIKMSLEVPSLADAEASLLRSRNLAIEQGALSWELRTATTWAELKCIQGDKDGAKDVLLPITARFSEGFDSVDMRRAQLILDGLA